MASKAQNRGGQRGSWWRIALWATAGILLLLPLVAMRFTGQVNWTASDFAFMGALLGGVGLGLELAVRNGNRAYMMAAAVALGAAAFLLVWINAAVGIIGSEDNPLNLMYGGVLAVGLGGATVARFQPAGMARAMVAAAAAQGLVGVIALVAGRGSAELPGSFGILALNGAFAALFLGSAWLFGRAAQGRSATC